MKTIATVIFIATLLGANILVASSDDLPPSLSGKYGYMVMANMIGTSYGVSIPSMKRIVGCESSWDAVATHVTKREMSYGLSQINRLAHPGVSVAQAEDPEFALDYLASGLSTNHASMWTCAGVK